MGFKCDSFALLLSSYSGHEKLDCLFGHAMHVSHHQRENSRHELGKSSGVASNASRLPPLVARSK